MADEGVPPQSPPDPAEAQIPGPPVAGVPPVTGAPYGREPDRYASAYGAQAPAEPPRRRRTAVWVWLGIIVVLSMCAVASCVWLSSLGRPERMRAMGGDAVAVIDVDGAIAGSGSAVDGVINPRDFVDQLRQAEDDGAVKAIVLDIQSPGGTVAASEEIAQEVAACPKPVIACIGDVGASGAYMVASQCDETWAMPGSTVGSIGVILEVPNVEGLLDKLGVGVDVITAGEYKDTGGFYRPLTKEERARLQGQVDEVYEQFIEIVAKGRDMPVDEVRKLATGWAWTGAEAKKLGLVDKLGTYSQAVEAAAKAGGIKGKPRIVNYETYEFQDLLSGLIGFSSKLERLGSLGGAPGADAAGLPR